MPTTKVYSGRKLEPAEPKPEAVTRSVGLAPSLTIVRGTVLGIITATKRYAAYNNANSNGTEVAKAVAMYDMLTDASSNITFGTGSGSGGEQSETYLTAPVYAAGAFRTEDLTGLDANAVTDLGRLVEGDTTTGLLHII